MRLSTAGKNAALNAVGALCNGGKLRIMTTLGTTANDLGSLILAEFDLGSPAFAAASGSSMAISGLPLSTTNIATGSAAYFQIVTSGNQPVCDGVVGGVTPDMSTDTLFLLVTGENNITSFALTYAGN